MKIALIQQRASRNREENIRRGVVHLEKAAGQGVQLALFSELSFDRFFPQRRASEVPLHLAETIPGPLTDLFGQKARETAMVVILNILERDGKDTYDASPVIDSDGTILGLTRMVHIADYEYFYEKSYYTPGNKGAPVYDTAVGKIGVAICYDRHYPEYMRALALKGAQLVVVPQAGTVEEWPHGLFEAEMQVASFQNGYFTALVNRVGVEDDLEFSGESLVTSPDGEVIARAPRGEDHMLVVDIDLSKVKESPARKMFLRDRRPDVYPLDSTRD